MVLEALSQPPIKLVTVGGGDTRLEVGNETVMFRHEEKFFHPCGIGFIIEDNLSDSEISRKIDWINKLKFERVGQKIEINLMAIRQTKDGQRFKDAVQLVSSGTSLSLVLMSDEPAVLKAALEITRTKRPLIYHATKDNLAAVAQLAKEFNLPLVVSAPDLDTLSNLTKELNRQGVTELVLDTEKKNLADKIWDLTQIRRQALRKSNRALGYPVLVLVDNADPYEEAAEAATFITKYASILLMKGTQSWQVLSLLTLRQNIYTDPQKPLQIEAKLYAIGQVTDKSPVLVTTNFSLSYYTVLSEVEASKIPVYIVSVDTEGMSVLTAWAAEKFTPDKIAESLEKCEAAKLVSHKRLIIPGYVAVMSGDLEEKSGWQITVGPKEAAGIPSFLKNLQ